MKLSAKNIVLNQLAQIELIQGHISALDSCVDFLARDQHATQILTAGNLRDKLYQEEVKAWRNLCMWGLTLDDDDRARIKAAVHDRLIVGKHVASWLTPDGRSTGWWMKADEDEFRAMARDAFLSATKE